MEVGYSVKTQPSRSDLGTIAELAGKSVLAMVATAYVLGLLIVNISMQRYDMQAMGLLHVQYVMSGCLLLGLTAIAVAGGRVSRWLVKGAGKNAREGRFIVASLVGIVGVVLPVIAVGFAVFPLSGYRLVPNDVSFWSAVGGVIFVAIAAWMLGTLGIGLWARRTSDGPHIRDFEMLRWTGHVLMFLTALYVFSLFVYPVIQPTFGGGRPTLAGIFLKADAPPDLKVLLGGSVSERISMLAVEVIADTGDCFVVHNPTAAIASTVAIRKDLIAAVATFPDLRRPLHPKK
jgi:hypothetical protein